MKLTKGSLYIILSFFSIYVIWGSTYVLNKIAVTQISPLFLASIRFITAGILIFVIAKFMKLSLAINKKQIINCIIAGFLFLAYGNGVFVWALRYVDSGFGALLASTQPLIVLILMRMLDGKRIKGMSVIGIILGIIGMYLLVSQKELVFQENTLLGIMMIFTCVISWSFGSLFVAKAELPSNFFINTGYQMLSGGVLLGITSFIIGEEWLSPFLWTTPVKISMSLLVLFGSIVAFTSFNYLLKVVSTEKVTTSAYVNPVIALILGWFVLDETITGQSIFAAAILLTGVYFINSKKNIRTLR